VHGRGYCNGAAFFCVVVRPWASHHYGIPLYCLDKITIGKGYKANVIKVPGTNSLLRLIEAHDRFFIRSGHPSAMRIALTIVRGGGRGG
jgi:hypothetical protein